MSLFISIMMGGLGLRFGKLGSQAKISAGGGSPPAAPDDTTSANEYLIFFV